MKTFMALGVVAAMGLASPAFSAVNLISNGGFEDGDFTSWTLGNVGGGTAPVVIPYGSTATYPGGAYGESIPPAPSGGNYAAYFSSDSANPDTLSQMVNVVSGQTYTLSFDYYVPLNGFNNPGDATLGFLINSIDAGTLNADLIEPLNWYSFSSSWTSTVTGSVALAFQFYGNSNGDGVSRMAADFVVDNVSMAAVPEPATWALLIAGFALVGVSMRRRRTTISFA